MEYEAAHIEVLQGRDAVRKRPGMYVGSIGERGLHHMVFEVVAPAVNAVLAEGGGRVDVTLTRDGGVRVADDGPGAPFEDAGDPGLQTRLTTLYTGPPIDDRRTVYMGGFCVGPFVVNALSARLTAEVRRDGVRRLQEHARGVALAPPAVVGPASGTGTTVAFWPDPEIFETTRCSFAVLAERFRQVAFLNPGLTMSLTDEHPTRGDREVRYRFPEGVRDFVAALDAEAGALLGADVIGFAQEDPRMAGTVEVALRWGDSGEERLLSFANSRPTPEGGAHVDGLRDGLAAAAAAFASERGLPAPTDAGSGAHRIGEGLRAVVSVKLDRPEFLGPVHGLLGGADVRACVADAVREHLGAWFAEHPDRGASIVGGMFRDPDLSGSFRKRGADPSAGCGSGGVSPITA
ncbi:ATP-binding protein [Streptomyces sp. LUP30]|uniref:ATP-binding protein n=1 Tax=Streptomyces sp. LUP30 TaxID=1890285 RepID=UPI0008517D69|nr:ATP-binding protein [Streptomyces sp. LUP30]